MLLKNDGWAGGEFLTITENGETAGHKYQIVRVDVERRGVMRTKGYQYRTTFGVESFRRLKDLREAHPR